MSLPLHSNAALRSRMAARLRLLATWMAACAFFGAGCGPPSEARDPGNPHDAATSPAPAPAETLHAAVLYGDLESVQRHLESGADVNERDPYGSTPLIIAATFGQTEAARALMAAGADIEMANAEGSSPLLIAAFFGRKAIVQALLDAGADRERQNHAGRSALDSVSAPFEEAKPGYDRVMADLAPLGLELDYDELRVLRPQIAQMLRQ